MQISRGLRELLEVYSAWHDDCVTSDIEQSFHPYAQVPNRTMLRTLGAALVGGLMGMIVWEWLPASPPLAESMTFDPALYQPPLHPLVIASLQVLLAAFAWQWFQEAQQSLSAEQADSSYLNEVI